MSKRMGLEGILYWGAAGSQATTVLTIARDVSYKIETMEADVSDRSTYIDITAPAGAKFSLEFEVNNQDTNAFIAAVRAAAWGGTAVAFRTKDKTAGYGVDGDFVVSVDESQALRDAQRIKVTATPTDINGRNPVWA